MKITIALSCMIASIFLGILGGAIILPTILTDPTMLRQYLLVGAAMFILGACSIGLAVLGSYLLHAKDDPDASTKSTSHIPPETRENAPR